MTRPDDAFAANQRRRFMRPDARRYIRPDAWHFMPPGAPRLLGKEAVRYFWPEYQIDPPAWRLERKYSPDQPRVPAGNPDGGQWTSEGGSTDFSASRRRPMGGRFPSATPAQEARLAIAQARADDAIRRVRELDPNWRPTPSLHESIEGAIRANEAAAEEAQARASELARVGVGPGPFAGESLPARGPGRDFTVDERSEINRIGSETGCHTCGSFDPGTNSGNFVPDHQLPNAINGLGRAQRLYPQCISCSDFQGGWISGNSGKR